MERELAIIFRQEEHVLRYNFLSLDAHARHMWVSMQCSEIVNAKEITNHPYRKLCLAQVLSPKRTASCRLGSLSICENAQLGQRTICVASQSETDNGTNCFMKNASFLVWFVVERERCWNLISGSTNIAMNLRWQIFEFSSRFHNSSDVTVPFPCARAMQACRRVRIHQKIIKRFFTRRNVLINIYFKTKPFLCLFQFFFSFSVFISTSLGTWYTVQGDWSGDAMIYRLTKGWAKAKINDPKCSTVIAQWHRPAVMVDSCEGPFGSRMPEM